jgi:two-component system chemotaxis response regulator CheB
LGVKAIKKMGGKVLVEDKKTAEFSGMPSAAIDTGMADWVLPLQQIGTQLVSLAYQDAGT